MSLLSYFDSSQLKSMLRASNYWASQNRNQYPEKLHRAIDELYEWIDCPCDDNCQCRKHGCKQHLVRRKGVGFETFFDHFLDCYISQSAKDAVRKGRENGRGSNAVPVNAYFRAHWESVYCNSISYKSLICTGWSIPPYDEYSKGFQPCGDTIYQAKWFTFLSINTYVAYDTGSVGLLKRDYGSSRTYNELMTCLRAELISHLAKYSVSIDEFLHYDDPSEFSRSIPSGGLMPIGVIIDRLYLTL